MVPCNTLLGQKNFGRSIQPPSNCYFLYCNTNYKTTTKIRLSFLKIWLPTKEEIKKLSTDMDFNCFSSTLHTRLSNTIRFSCEYLLQYFDKPGVSLWTMFYLFVGREVTLTKCVIQLMIWQELALLFIREKSVHITTSNKRVFDLLICSGGVCVFVCAFVWELQTNRKERESKHAVRFMKRYRSTNKMRDKMCQEIETRT